MRTAPAGFGAGPGEGRTSGPASAVGRAGPWPGRHFKGDQLRWAGGFSLAVMLLSVVPALFAHPHLNYDSGGYLAPPALSSGRLPLVPLVFLLLGHNLRAITVFQATVGGVCWAAVLREAAYLPAKVVRLVAMLGIAAIACSTYVVNWYAAILSESLSISLLALIIALLVRWQRTRTSLWPLVLTSAAWGLTRSTNAYIVVIVGLGLVFFCLVRVRQHVKKALTLLSVGLFATMVSAQGQLWQQPFLHSMSERILPNPEFTAWFAHHGMPVSPPLLNLAGPDVLSTDTSFHQSPDLASFRQWMDRSGQTTYLEFLASHPGWILGGTFGGHEELGPGLVSYYGGGVSRPWIPGAIRNIFLSHRQASLFVLGAIDLAVIIAAGLRRSLTRKAALWGGVVCLGVMTLIIDWAGDSWEIGRHSVEGTVVIALASLVLIFGGEHTKLGSVSAATSFS